MHNETCFFVSCKKNTILTSSLLLSILFLILPVYAVEYDTTQVGRTYFDNQHHGSVGRFLIMQDAGSGYNEPHGALTYTETDIQQLTRFVALSRFAPGYSTNPPMNISYYERSGYSTISMDVLHNMPITALHGLNYNSNEIELALNYILPLIGSPISETFDNSLYPNDFPLLWPKIASDNSGNSYIVATEYVGDPYDYGALCFYKATNSLGGFFNLPGLAPNILFPEMEHISADIAVSSDGQRVAVAFTVNRHLIEEDYVDYTGMSNDVYLRISEDGGENWNETINLSDFFFEYNPVNMEVNTDELRGWDDVNVYIDHNDIIHVAFPAHTFTIDYNRPVPDLHFRTSHIFHWDEVSNTWYRAADGNFDNGAEIDYHRTMVCRPSMVQDPESGVLYLAYQQYGQPGDSLDVSDRGYANSEIYVTATPPHPEYYGKLWTQAINVTNTNITEPGGGSAGECMSETGVCAALQMPGDYLYLAYMMDRHAGNSWSFDNSEHTENEMVVQRIDKTELIDEYTAWLPDFPFHIDSSQYYEDPHNWAFEPWGFYCDGRDENNINDKPEQPQGFKLHQNWPNPFNSVTNIRFELPDNRHTWLTVYDITGREVLSLINKSLQAGTHQINFDGKDLASGIYYIKLQAGEYNKIRKAVLIK